jgi:lysozyme
MKLNSDGYRLIALHEGFKSKPYLCPAKIPTIGYGNTYYPDGTRVTLLDKPINEKEAFDLGRKYADTQKDKWFLIGMACGSVLTLLVFGLIALIK